MKSLRSGERMLLAVVLSAVLAVAFYVFIYTPQKAKIARLEGDLARQQTELKRLQDLAATKDAKEKEYAALAERIRLVEVRLPPEREIPALIRQLMDTARELGTRLTLLRPGATQAPAAAPGQNQRPPQQAQQPRQPQQAPAPVYQQFRVDLAFEGSYEGLMAFLGRLENFPRFLVLKQLAITPGELPRLRVTLAAETFLLPRERLPQP